jgi:hypothetical protein
MFWRAKIYLAPLFINQSDPSILLEPLMHFCGAGDPCACGAGDPCTDGQDKAWDNANRLDDNQTSIAAACSVFANAALPGLCTCIRTQRREA